MKVIEPMAVTDAMLTSSVSETDYPLWNAGTAYVKGARVLQTGAHSVFESVIDANLGNDPVITSPGKWIAIRATNRWAMFDDAVGSATSATGSIIVTLAPAAAIEALGVLDTDAASVRVQVKRGAVVLFDETRAATGTADEPASLHYLDLPTDAAAAITITLTAAGPSDPVSVGTVVFGELLDLGLTEAGPSVGINDFSRRNTDEFGATTVVERAWAKRMTLRSMIPTDRVDEIQRRLAALRAKPALWLGDDGFDSLIIFGFFKDFSIDLALETISYCSLTIEGLTKAPELQPIDSGLGAFLTNEMHTLPADGDGNVTSYAGAAGQFRIFSGLEDIASHFVLSTQDNPQSLTVNYTDQSYAVTGGLDVGEPAASLLIRATGTGPYSGLVIDKQFSLSKSSAGADGAPAKTLTLLSDRQTIAYDAAGAPSPASQTTAFSTNKQNTTATVNWSVTDANGVARTPVASYLSAATGNSVTMTEAQFAAARNGTSGVIVTASISDGGTISDKISVVRVQAGAKGDIGATGSTGAKGDKGDTGTAGKDAISFVQEATPGAPSSTNQLWFKPSTKQFFRWNGTAWAVMLGTLSQYDQIVTSLIKADTIVASHFVTDQGVDLAAIVPGALTTASNASQVGSYDILASPYLLSSGALNVSSSNDVIFTSLEFQITNGNTTGYCILQRLVGGVLDGTVAVINAAAGIGTYRFDFQDRAHGTGSISYRLNIARNGGTILTIQNAKISFTRLSAK